MSLDITKLTRVSSGPTQLWLYSTNDLATAVDADDYFLANQPHMNVGDIIIAATDMDGTQGSDHYVVTVSDATNLNISLNANAT